MHAEPVRIELRPPGRWSSRLAQALGLGVVGAVGVRLAVPAHAVPPGIEWIVPIALGTGLVVLALRALLAPPTALAIELGAARLSLPRWRMSRRASPVPYADVFDARVAGRGSAERTVLGVRGHTLLAYPLHDFVAKDGGAELVRELRLRVLALPDGPERIAALDQRAEVAASLRRTPWVLAAVAVVLLAAFMVQLFTQAAPPELHLVRLGANVRTLVADGELFRLVTGNLLHGGALHFALNLVALLGLGVVAEGTLGHARFTIVLLASALGGSIASHVIAAAPVSVGSSTAVFGLIGALAFLNLQRREELPAGLWLPGWLWALLVTAEVAVELIVPGIDHGAHLGGFATGWAASALALGGAPLPGLATRRSGFAVAGALLLATAFAAGIAREIDHARRSDPASELRFIDALIRDPASSPVTVNNLAFLLAVATDVEPEYLEGARQAMDRLLENAPGVDAFWDTQATLYYRLADFDRAVEAGRRARALGDSAYAASQLARFEAARLAAAGPLLLGPGAEALVPTVVLEASGAGDPGERVIVVQFTEPPPPALVLHALARREQRLLGLLSLRLDGQGPSRLRLANPASPQNGYGSDVRFEVALVDTRAANALEPPPGWRLWAMDPSVEPFPGPLPVRPEQTPPDQEP